MSKKEEKNVEELINNSIANIESDRNQAKDLLDDIVSLLNQQKLSSTSQQGQGTRSIHKDLGETAAKYLETLQRSNEQLVKLIGLMKKKETNKDEKISEQENNELMDIISKTK